MAAKLPETSSLEISANVGNLVLQPLARDHSITFKRRVRGGHVSVPRASPVSVQEYHEPPEQSQLLSHALPQHCWLEVVGTDVPVDCIEDAEDGSVHQGDECGMTYDDFKKTTRDTLTFEQPLSGLS